MAVEVGQTGSGTQGRAQTAPVAWSCIVQQFAREPVPGAVKTRMQPVLTAEQACDLHCELALHTLDLLRSAALGALQLWVAGDTQHVFFDAWRPLASVHQQWGRDLGERMFNALSVGLEHAPGVLLVGSDCPFLDRAYLHQAAAALLHHDVVLGPAEDGGYVLIGARRIVPAVFADVHWGTSEVLAQTRVRLRQSGLSWHCLPKRQDVDTPEDLPAWKSVRGT